MGSLAWCSDFLPQLRGLIGNSKLPIGVNVIINGCLSIYQPCDELATCPGYTLPVPSVSWDWFQLPPATLYRISGYR